MKKSQVRLIVKEEIEKMIGRGGSKDVYLSNDSNKVTKKFSSNINKDNLIKEKELGNKYPDFIAKIYDLTNDSLTQEKLNVKKLGIDIKLALSEEGIDLFDESNLDDEFEFIINHPEFNTNSQLKNKITKLNDFVKNILIKKENIPFSKLDYPNINNVGYDGKGNIKLLEIFY